MNKKMIVRMLCHLLLLEAVLLLPSAGISFFLKETAALKGILTTILLLSAAGGAGVLACRKAEKKFYAREGFVIVALAWILMSVFGALPFWFSREIPAYIDAFFEVVSGFTTTGASILTDVESMSHGLLYWRSFTHWLGGMGILVFLLAVVPSGRGSGYTLHLLRAESPGPSVGKLVPKMRQTATILYKIYIGLTLACFAFLLAGGMPLFDAVCTSFGTAGTGGFGIRADSMLSYSPYLQWVVTVFMALFGVNFTVYYLLLMRNLSAVLFDEELRAYLGIFFASIFVITLDVFRLFPTLGDALRHVSFTVSSIMTTTGFATVDFNLWPQFSRTVLVLLMICGASAGSTGGGVKVARLILQCKSLARELRRLLRPNSVRVVKMNGNLIEDKVLRGVDLYMAAYGFILIFSFLIISIDDFSLETNITAVLACLNNIGPGLDLVGPTGNYFAFSPFSKLILSANMLLGRLEIFPILLMLSPHTWSRKS